MDRRKIHGRIATTTTTTPNMGGGSIMGNIGGGVGSGPRQLLGGVVSVTAATSPTSSSSSSSRRLLYKHGMSARKYNETRQQPQQKYYCDSVVPRKKSVSTQQQHQHHYPTHRRVRSSDTCTTTTDSLYSEDHSSSHSVTSSRQQQQQQQQQQHPFVVSRSSSCDVDGYYKYREGRAAPQPPPPSFRGLSGAGDFDDRTSCSRRTETSGSGATSNASSGGPVDVDSVLDEMVGEILTRPCTTSSAGFEVEIDVAAAAAADAKNRSKISSATPPVFRVSAAAAKPMTKPVPTVLATKPPRPVVNSSNRNPPAASLQRRQLRITATRSEIEEVDNENDEDGGFVLDETEFWREIQGYCEGFEPEVITDAARLFEEAEEELLLLHNITPPPPATKKIKEEQACARSKATTTTTTTTPSKARSALSLNSKNRAPNQGGRPKHQRSVSSPRLRFTTSSSSHDERSSHSGSRSSPRRLVGGWGAHRRKAAF